MLFMLQWSGPVCQFEICDTREEYYYDGVKSWQMLSELIKLF